MKEISPEQQAQLNLKLKLIKSLLQKFIAVKDVGIGYAMKNGEITDKLSVIVYIDKKYPPDFLNKAEIIPKEINGINIDVMEYNPILHADPYSRVNNLLGGIIIGNARLSGGGTLGAIFKGSDNSLIGLTNWHVAKNRRGRLHDIIVQPAWQPATADFTIGKLLNWDENLDCAIFSIESRPIDHVNDINDTVGKITKIVQPLLGMNVFKSGARSGLTYGIIQSLKGSAAVIVPNKQKPQRTDHEISLAGDSGSLWIKDNGEFCAVALHWGGATKDYTAYANDLTKISQLMKFTVQ